MRWTKSLLRWGLIVCGVVLLTSITVDATFAPGGVSQSALGIITRSIVPTPSCPAGMREVKNIDVHLCVDQFESAPGVECPETTVQDVFMSRKNIDALACMPRAEKGVSPWVFVTMDQARDLCARRGARLPTPHEWYALALGSPDSESGRACVVEASARSENNTESRCVTGSGVYNAVGNVWEWVEGTVTDGVFDQRQVPKSGYVAAIDNSGIARETHGERKNPDYKNDYFWSDQAGEYGILRGGFYGSGDDAGLYSVQAKTPRAFASDAIGFRCVTDWRE
jgi:hypothetical protein